MESIRAYWRPDSGQVSEGQGIMHHVAVRLLGPPQIERDGVAIKVESRKAIALLAYLALHPEGCSRDELAALFWPEEAQDRARSNLRYALWALKKALGEGGLEVERERLGLRWQTGLWLDIAHARAQLAACRTHSHAATAVCPRCLPLLREAVSAPGDDFMAGFSLPDCPDFESWQMWQREEWRRLLDGALARLVSAAAAAGEMETAVALARRRLALDDLNESAHRLLMRAYHWAGQLTAALRQFQLCTDSLAKELGVTPEPATVELYDTLKRGQPLPLPELSAMKEPVDLPPPVTGVSAVEAPLCLERQPELTRMLGWLSEALRGRGRVGLIAGEAGSGKTVLLREFARRAADADETVLIAAGACPSPAGPGVPYLPFRAILRQLSGDVESAVAPRLLMPEQEARLRAHAPAVIGALYDHGPDLIANLIPAQGLAQRAATLLPPESPIVADLERRAQVAATQRAAVSVRPGDLYEQIVTLLRAIARQRPLLLLIDNLHWADTASLNLLYFLAQHLADAPYLCLATYRPGDLAVERGVERHPLETIVNELQRLGGDIEINLESAHSRKFVEAWLDTQPNRLNPAFRATLFRHTQGHPLFTVELVQAMRERGEIVLDASGHWVEGEQLVWDRVPARVAAVITERLDRLSEPLHDLLTVAAVEGDVFTVEVVARVHGAPERQVMRQIQELEKRHRLVQRRGERRIGLRTIAWYQFAHALFRQQLLKTLSDEERRLIHAGVAAALADLFAGQLDDIAGILAHHHAAAGDSVAAVRFLLLAGDRARALQAHQEAADAYQRALELLTPLHAYDQMARTTMKLGLIHHLALDFPRAREAFEEGFALRQKVRRMAAGGALPPAVRPLRLAWLDPPTLDPTMAGTMTATEVINQLFSGLVALTPDLDVAPDVARSWDVVDGGRRYIFHLRENAYWRDGEPLTAEDFVFAWRRGLTPATGSHNANLLHALAGARAFHQGESDDPETIGVRALDRHTLAVELERPTGHFLHLMAHCASFPVPRHIVAADADWSAQRRLVSNGPYLLERLGTGHVMTFVRNPDFHGRFPGNVQGVELRLLPGGDWATRLEQYEAGDLDVIRDLPPAVWDRVRQRYADEYQLGPWLETRYVGFDARRPPFDDPRVRQALGHAVDKEQLANLDLGGYYVPATGGFIPPGMPGYAPAIGLAHDPTRAQSLLDASGYGKGRGFPVITALRPPGHEVDRLSEALTDQWRTVLGIDIAWETMAWGVLRLHLTPPPLFLIAWKADYPDPDNYLRVAAEDGGWHTETLATLVARAEETLSREERLARYAQADRHVVESATIVPLFYGRSHLLIKRWVRAFPTSPMQLWFWKEVILADD